MRNALSLLLFVLATAVPQPARGQSMFDLMRSIQQGGGWVQIEVKGGRGTYLSSALPTLGLTLTGCMQVYAGHAGTWEIEATDPLGEGRLNVSVVGGETVPFSYRSGSRAQLRVDASWSLLGDTTLFVWVGLETPLLQRDVCEPVYAEDVGFRE